MKTFREYLINEEIIGNTAIVYHRGDKNKLDHLLDKTYSNSAHIDFVKYSKGLYTTTSMSAQLNQAGNRNDMKGVYGNYIIKLAFKGVSNCWFCSFDEYKKYNDCTIDNWKEQQFKKFNIDKKYWNQLAGNDENFTANHTHVSGFFEKYNLLGTRVKGIQYDGKYDGDCLLIYDWTTAVPLAISNDEGKTWEKIDKNKTTFQRNNFKNNDYIDTDKKIKYELKPDENGNINCSNKEITTLKGAPQKVDGDFDCHSNRLTTLEGALQKVGKDFYCSFNQLTTLKGAPKEVGGNFDCDRNQLTTLEGAPKEVGGGFYCTGNQLTTLKGAPEKVGKDFYCSDNKLTTLKGAPKEVGGDFSCSDNKLTTLKGAPEKVGDSLYCSDNGKLSKEEIINYLKTAKIGGVIVTDYGSFNNQKEALENLTTIKESYFNY